MTPSNSPVQVFARRPETASFAAPQSGNIFRRLFDRAQDSAVDSQNDQVHPTSSNGRNRANGSADAKTVNGGNVSGLLRDTVLDLWLDERTQARAPFHQANGSMRENVGDVFTLQTVTCKKEAGDVLTEDARREVDVPGWKRLLDVTLIVLSAPIWLPLMLILMLGVRVSSSGPIFYRQERIGHHGRRFMIYKFRSMKVDAETQVHEAHLERLIRESVPMMKLDGAGDPRILPWGRLMRATGLDELPQIFNVLRGEMSLVGPRPCTVHEFSRYAKWQQERVKAAPGLTGYWQVNGKNKTTFNEMIDMDIFYAKNLCLGLDLRILAQTIPALAAQTLESFRSRQPRLSQHAFSPNAKTGAEI